MLRGLETRFFVLALALLVAVEGGCVYGIRHHPSFRKISPGSISICGYWISPILSQCWLIGGLFILSVRLLNAVRSGGFHGDRTSLRINKLLLRQWTWLSGLALLQGCALYIDSLMPVSR